MDNPEKLKHVSLCTGYGGIDIGLSRALGDVRTVAYVEIEAFAAENLVAKIEHGHLDVAPIWTDLKTFPWSLYRGRVDIISGGFPCQPFSGAGRRAGDEDPRHLFPYILDGLRELGRPSLVFLENVEGIISSKLKGDGWNDPEGTPVLLHVLRELERLGYEATAGVFSAREIGAPHQRKRVFIMGVRSDLGESGRALVSRMLRDTESGVNLVDSCDNGRQCTRASIYCEGRTLDGRRARVSSERDAPNTHAQHASLSANMEHATSARLEGRPRASLQRRSARSPRSSTAYPAPRGAEQYAWEPPRVTVGDAKSGRNQRVSRATARTARETNGKEQRGVTYCSNQSNRTAYPAPRGAGLNDTGEAQSSMGGDADGASDRMDYAELCYAVDNRTDELRLLGNGVVPGTAERAFKELWRALN